jgi:hypothetical protein
MSRLLLLHGRLQLTIAGLLALLLAWALFGALRGRIGQGYLAGLWIAALLIGAQCLIGVVLLVENARPLSYALHMVYGVVAALGLPAAIAYNRGRHGRRAALIFAAACLLLLGVIVRAYQTAG